MRQEVTNKIYESMDEIKDMIDNPNDLKKSENTILYGDDSALDSMAMVGLVASLEQKINEQFDTSLVLANEKAVSRRNSPFKDVTTLSDYVVELLKEENKGI